MKVLYNKEAKKYGEARKNMKLTYVRFLEEEEIVLSATNMFLDYIAIFDYRKTPTCILIKSENITHNFINYFEKIWKTAKE